MARTPKGSYSARRKLWYVTLWGKQRVLARGPKKDAEGAARAELRRLIALGRPEEKPMATRLTLDSLSTLYLDHVEREHEPETYRSYNNYIASFVKSVGRESLAEDTKVRDVEDWITRGGNGPSTNALKITIIKTMFRWGKRRGDIEANPIAELQRPTALIRELVLSAEQAEIVWREAGDDEFRELLTGLRETGARPGEIYTLTCDRVDLNAGTWRVKNKTRRKTGEPWRTIYLSPAAIELSRRLTEGREGEGRVFRNSVGSPWQDCTVRRRFEVIRDRLKFKAEVTAYAYRHLYCTEALMRGVPPATVAELMGHTSTKMVMRVYSKLSKQTEYLREAAKQARNGG